jgi:hypothetical protein
VLELGGACPGGEEITVVEHAAEAWVSQAAGACKNASARSSLRKRSC